MVEKTEYGYREVRPEPKKRWFENPLLRGIACIVFWIAALASIYLACKIFAIPFDWFDDLFLDWIHGYDARRFAAWTATSLSWILLALMIVFRRRIVSFAKRIFLGTIRTARRTWRRVEEETRP